MLVTKNTERMLEVFNWSIKNWFNLLFHSSFAGKIYLVNVMCPLLIQQEWMYCSLFWAGKIQW